MSFLFILIIHPLAYLFFLVPFIAKLAYMIYGEPKQHISIKEDFLFHYLLQAFCRIFHINTIIGWTTF